MPGAGDKGPKDVRVRVLPEHELTIERMGGRKDMDYGAVIGAVGFGIMVLGALASFVDPQFGIFALAGLVAMLVGVGRFVRGVIRVRSTR